MCRASCTLNNYYGIKMKIWTPLPGNSRIYEPAVITDLNFCRTVLTIATSCTAREKERERRKKNHHKILFLPRSETEVFRANTF